MNAADQTRSNQTRATSARVRRENQSSARSSSVAQRAVSEAPQASRPVTVRNTTFGTPVRNRVATHNPRRQYYVALDAPGTELRLPALPVMRFSARTLSIFLVVGSLMAIFALLVAPIFSVDSATVNGLERLDQAAVQSFLDLEGTPVVFLNAADLTAALREKYPILERVKVSIALPNRVTVDIKERQPIFAWKVGETVTWTDSSGVLFAAVGETPQILTISADSKPPVYVSPEDLKALEQAKKDAAANKTASNNAKTSNLKKTVTAPKPDKIDPGLMAAAQKLSTYFPGGMTLTYMKDHGLGWQDPGGWEVYIGKDLESFDQKYALYQAISQQLAGQSITPAIISVEFLDEPYYRLEK